MTIFKFDKENMLNDLFQLGYNILFAGVCASIAVFIMESFVPDTHVPWNTLWLAVAAAVLVITYIYQCIAKHFFPDQYAGGQENYEEDPIYAYHNYCNGYAAVEKVIYTDPKHKTNRTEFSFVSKDGKFITNRWYGGVSEFFEEGVAAVHDSETGKYNIIDGRGVELMDEWVDNMEVFHDGVAKVYRKAYRVVQLPNADGVPEAEAYAEYTEINFVNASGELIWDKWKEAL